MNAIWQIAKKDLLLLWRDKPGLFWVIGFPLIMALFFGSIFSGDGDSGRGAMRLVVVNQDSSGFAAAMVSKLAASPSIRLDSMTLDSARNAVRVGKRSALLQIKKGFGQSAGFSRDTNLALGIDPARKAEGAMLQGLLMQAYMATLASSVTDKSNALLNVDSSLARIESDSTLSPERRERLRTMFAGLDQLLESFPGATGTPADSGGVAPSFARGPNMATIPITNERIGPATSWEITFPSSILWALLGCCGSFAVSIVIERTRGTLLRLRLAPLTRMQILLGKGLACWLACVVVGALLIAFGHFVFGVRIMNLPGLAIALGATAVCFVGLMMIISQLGRTEQAVSGSGWAVLLVMSMTGGGMIPLFFMPDWMQTLSNFSPVKWGVLALEGSIWRNFTTAEMIVPITVLLLIGLVGFGLGSWLINRREVI